MANSLRDSFERCCRLCAEEQDVTIMIFSAEAEAMLLQNKLNQYLLIEVDEDDKLPKNICIKCCSKLQIVCEFIDTARKAQTLLLNRSLDLDQVLNDKSFDSSLNHEIKLEPESQSDEETESTGMEVSVDPMVVLQNSEESLCSPKIHENGSSIEDVTHLHDVDSENVTIKLIRKGDVTTEDCDKNEDQQCDDKDSTLKPFPCVTCKRAFITELALKNHAWTHMNEEKDINIFKCNTCDSSFFFKCELITHLKEHKVNDECKFCGRCFRSRKNLDIHMSVHLPNNRSYTCKVCGRSYKTKSNLKTHSITHSNERPFQCQICKKSFKRNQDLKFHFNQHTGARPYKCPFCDKCFASSGNCYSHRSRMHPGRTAETKLKYRPPIIRENQVNITKIPRTPLTSVKGIYKYQCTMCEHSFMKRDNFTYHMFQHTGVKPFQCSFCPKKFVTRKGLLIHHDKDHSARDRPLALLSKNILLK